MRIMKGANRVAWLAGGLIAGLAIAYLWPHEPTYATTGDRDTQFSMVTVPVGTSAAGINDPIDGIFILDFLSGQLKGAVLSRQVGGFVSFYYRDLSKDFGVDPEADPHYCMVTGYAQMPNQGGFSMASGVLYVGELTSGKVAAYAFPWKETGTGGPVALVPLDSFPWKQPSPKKK
ncbi:MAG TPA: hypothetical protein VKU82_01800 [Planctomycetaceae bacterium]|nr:hypothetical protein [Planctomycetaceae bacterium]